MKEEKNVVFISIFGNILRIFFLILIIYLFFIYKKSFNEILNLVVSLYNSNFYIFNITIVIIFIFLIVYIYADYIKISIMIHLEKSNKSKFKDYYLDEERFNVFNVFSPIGYKFENFIGRRKFINDLFFGNDLKLDNFLSKRINLYRTVIYSYYISIILVLVFIGVYWS